MARFHSLMSVRGCKWVIKYYDRDGRRKFVAESIGYEPLFSETGISEDMIRDHMRRHGWTAYGVYGSRRTAESVADKLRKDGWATTIQTDQFDNQTVLYRERRR